MLIPSHALHKRYFYPIGNTAAVSLVSHQSPGKGIVDVLRLGCGDVRNALYTVFCNENEQICAKKFVLCRCPEGQNAVFRLVRHRARNYGYHVVAHCIANWV